MTDKNSPFPASFDPLDLAGALAVATEQWAGTKRFEEMMEAGQAAANAHLRDQFALEAMRAILQKNEEWADDDEIARCCYDMADAMMAARSAGE